MKRVLLRFAPLLLLVGLFSLVLVVAPIWVRGERERRGALPAAPRADRWVVGPAPAPEHVVWRAPRTP